MTTALTTRDGADITSGVMKLLMMIVVAALMVDVVTRLTSSSLTTQYIQSQMYQGVTDPRECDVTSEGYILDLVGVGHFAEWVSAEFINDGPDSVWIAINYPDEKFEIKADEGASINRIGALERIKVIYFYCDTGETAKVRIIGEY